MKKLNQFFLLVKVSALTVSSSNFVFFVDLHRDGGVLSDLASFEVVVTAISFLDYVTNLELISLDIISWIFAISLAMLPF